MSTSIDGGSVGSEIEPSGVSNTGAWVFNTCGTWIPTSDKTSAVCSGWKPTAALISRIFSTLTTLTTRQEGQLISILNHLTPDTLTRKFTWHLNRHLNRSYLKKNDLHTIILYIYVYIDTYYYRLISLSTVLECYHYRSLPALSIIIIYQ